MSHFATEDEEPFFEIVAPETNRQANESETFDEPLMVNHGYVAQSEFSAVELHGRLSGFDGPFN